MSKIRENNIRTRLEDANRQYNDNESMIKKLKKVIDSAEGFSVHASNGTVSSIPELNQWKDLQKINITLRKQINDMDMLIQNGALKEESDNPFA